MNGEFAPSLDMSESGRLVVAQGILSERHGISLADAARLLIALAGVGGLSPTGVASQIIDATIRPDHPAEGAARREA